MKATKGNRCDQHAADYENRRGSRTARGYGSKHVAAREEAAPGVLAGLVDCWRCGEPILPGEEWDLGHLDDGRIGGPEHRGRCNRRAAAMKGHGKNWTEVPGRNSPPPAASAPLSADLSLARAERQRRADRAAERLQRRRAERGGQ